MRISRRELLGYAVAGTTGMAVTATARQSGSAESEGAESDARSGDSRSPSDEDARRHWQLGRVHARPAKVEDTAVTFRGSVRSSYDTSHEVRVALYYRSKPGRQDENTSWQRLTEDTGALSEGVYLEATETGLDVGTTYQYRTEAALADYVGTSRRVSEIREVTAGEPCSGPSTNCLRAETLEPAISNPDVTLRGRTTGLESYDAVTGHFFYRREDESEQWTDFAPVEGGGDAAEFSATLSELPSGTYTYYAEVRGEGGGPNNMYAEGDERRFTVE
jgi:hypothetical protein